MIFDKSMLLAASGREGDESGVLKCSWSVPPTGDEGGRSFVISMDREDSTNPNCWLITEAIYEVGTGLISYCGVCVPLPVGYYDDEDLSKIELSIGGWSGFPFKEISEVTEPFDGDGDYCLYELRAEFGDDGVVVPAFADLVDGQKKKVTVKIKGIDSLQGS